MNRQNALYWLPPKFETMSHEAMKLMPMPAMCDAALLPLEASTIPAFAAPRCKLLVFGKGGGGAPTVRSGL